MKEKKIIITPEFVVDLIKRRRWLILLPLSIALAAGMILATISPRIFEATTLILVEGQRVSQNYVQSITTEENSDQINTITQQILSRTSLEKIIDEFDLFEGADYADMYMEKKIERLRKNIFVEVITDRRRRQTDAFEIKFKGKDPQKVMLVANGLAKTFIDENLRLRESQAIGTSVFLESELETARIRLERVEEEIKDYRKTYMGELPEQLETNLRLLERLQDDLSDRQQSLRDAKIRMANLNSQVSRRQSQPSVVVIGGDPHQQDGVLTIDDLVAELESLQSRYTDQHPDVIRIKKQIDELRDGPKNTYRAQLSANLPAELRIQFAEVRREISLADSEIENIKIQMEAYQQRVENTPKREQELIGLRRDYENIQTSYDSLLGRKLEADIAVNMERKQKGAQFRIIDPARLPQRPIEPNLRKLFLMVVVIGMGIGFGTAFSLEYMNPTYIKPSEIENDFGVKVLTAIPTIYNSKQVLLYKLETVGSILFTVVTFCLLAALGIITIKGI